MWKELTNEIFSLGLNKFHPRLRLKPYQECGTAIASAGRSKLEGSGPQMLRTHLEKRNLLLNLYYAHLLEVIELPHSEMPLRVLDIGSKNFVYAPAMALWLNELAPSFELTGLEVDPFRYYYDLYRRVDAAHYYSEVAEKAAPRGKVTYRQGNWLQTDPSDRWDLITCFFPFLYPELHQSSGLSRDGFDPAEFYEKMFSQADTVVLAHQGKQELETSMALLEKIPKVKITQSFSIAAAPHWKKQFSTEVLVIQANAD